MAPTNETQKRPRPIVLSGPSGSGKSTILKKLLAKYPEKFDFSVSHTTRSPRPGEEDGKAYYFITRSDFENLIDKKGFIEHATFGKNLYGTSFDAVKKVQGQGKICILDIEMEGVKQLHKSSMDCRYIFLSPPSYEELERRLRGRGTDNDEDIDRRLKQARVEMEYSETQGVHDLIIVNDDLDKAYGEVEGFCLKED